jgi:hypothetical protein
MKEKEEVRYYPGMGVSAEIIERGIPSPCGNYARIRLNDGRELLVPELQIASPLSERKKQRASE